jgi:hypothetical protein
LVLRLIEITSRQQQTQRTLLDWPRSKKLKAETEERKTESENHGR